MTHHPVSVGLGIGFEVGFEPFPLLWDHVGSQPGVTAISFLCRLIPSACLHSTRWLISRFCASFVQARVRVVSATTTL